MKYMPRDWIGWTIVVTCGLAAVTVCGLVVLLSRISAVSLVQQ